MRSSRREAAKREIKRTNKMNKMNTKLSLIECNGAHEITIYFLSAGQKAKGSRGSRISINIYICMYVYVCDGCVRQ